MSFCSKVFCIKNVESNVWLSNSIQFITKNQLQKKEAKIIHNDKSSMEA